jgi:hypothetical protein
MVRFFDYVLARVMNTGFTLKAYILLSHQYHILTVFAKVDLLKSVHIMPSIDCEELNIKNITRTFVEF